MTTRTAFEDVGRNGAKPQRDIGIFCFGHKERNAFVFVQGFDDAKIFFNKVAGPNPCSAHPAKLFRFGPSIALTERDHLLFSAD